MSSQFNPWRTLVGGALCTTEGRGHVHVEHSGEGVAFWFTPSMTLTLELPDSPGKKGMPHSAPCFTHSMD